MTTVTIETKDKHQLTRQCGTCSLCCKLLPMTSKSNAAWKRAPEVVALYHGQNALPEFTKPAGVPCKYQKFHKGCTMYARRPMGCRVWSCRWLVADDTGELHRPDRAGYVIDLNPDFIRCDADGESHPIECIQIWVDPKRRDAHRDPKLRAYLMRQAERGKLALIRFNEREGLVLIPPSWASDGKWHEIDPGLATHHHGETWPDDVKAILAMTD